MIYIYILYIKIICIYIYVYVPDRSIGQSLDISPKHVMILKPFDS